MLGFVQQASGRHPSQGAETADEVWGSGWADTTWGVAAAPAPPPARTQTSREPRPAMTWSLRAKAPHPASPSLAEGFPTSGSDAEQTRMG
jgi:hypothetical protein